MIDALAYMSLMEGKYIPKAEDFVYILGVLWELKPEMVEKIVW